MATNRNRFSGSGVLIIDLNSFSLLLIHDYTKDYNCCGGRADYVMVTDERLKTTAVKELREETRTLLSITVTSLDECPFVDIPVPHVKQQIYFRCFLLKMYCPADICEQFDCFDTRKLPDDGDFREVKNLMFFPLNQFLQESSFMTIMHKNKARDRNGTLRSLNRRVISVIEAALRQNLLPNSPSNNTEHDHRASQTSSAKSDEQTTDDQVNNFYT